MRLFFSFIAAVLFSLTLKLSAEAETQRGPAVLPTTEIEIENKALSESGFKGYNFETNRKPSSLPGFEKNLDSANYLYGFGLFLLSLPLAVWFLFYKKSHDQAKKERDLFFHKTHQFSPFKTEYQKSVDGEEDEDESNFPKAS